MGIVPTIGNYKEKKKGHNYDAALKLCLEFFLGVEL
jgi:hypothetical protein